MIVGRSVMDTCGHSLKKECFYLYDELLNLNHGSFGTVPKEVVQVQHEYHVKQESCPELWFREWYALDINAGRQCIADLIKAETDDVVFVENASYAVNSITASLDFKPMDVVICFDCAYRMVKEALWVVSSKTPLRVVYIPIQYPIRSEEELVASFKAELDKYEVGGVKLCIIDHVSSMPTIAFPVKELTALAKAKGSLVLIDGAHAPGMVEIDVEAIGADLYTGNCHKWLFAPKGAAFLWTRREVQSDTFPLPCVISSMGKRDYVGRFEYTGTRDYTPFLALPAALRFIDSRLGGIETMRRYNRALLSEGSRRVIDRWRTYYVVPEGMTGYMSNVTLPGVKSMHQVRELERRLMQDHISIKCECVPRRVDGGADSLGSEGSEGSEGGAAGELIFFVRLSAQVYLQLSDYEVMAEAVLRLLPEVVDFE